MFNGSFLLASLVWSSIGLGYFVYGKKQRLWVPMVGGAIMIGASYLAGTAMIMSIVGVVIMAAVYVLLKEGY